MGLKSDFRISALEIDGVPRSLLKIIGPPLDLILGIRKLRRMYEESSLAGLEKYTFLERLFQYFNIRYEMPPEELTRIPKTGCLMIVANHPLGGLEGIILAYILRQIRPDYKFFVNIVLSVIKELKDFFIYVNNNIPYARGTFKAISECRQFLEDGHCLILFPAGRVGVYDPRKGYVTDEKWNNISCRLMNSSAADVVPLYIHGTSSTFFSWATRLFYPAKLILLAWEFISSLRKKVRFSIGRPISYKILQAKPREQCNAYLRMRTYLLAGVRGTKTPVIRSGQDPATPATPADSIPPDVLSREIRGLPVKQHLLDSRNFSVYYGYSDQLPRTIREIIRLRKLTQRQAGESSRPASKTDAYDKAYTHLFIWDNSARQIIGAYRMGETRRIIPESGTGGMYLNQQYHYNRVFLNKLSPGLEIGPSFIIPGYQHPYYASILLRKGIGRFLVRNPGYRYLFGTVSLNNVHSETSRALLVYALVGKRCDGMPRKNFRLQLHPEVEEYIDKYGLTIRELEDIVPDLEPDGSGFPAQVKQYAEMGARFLSVCPDPDLNNTPGIFLSIDMLQVPQSVLKHCLRDEYIQYLVCRQKN